MAYINAAVAAVPKANKQAYLDHAKTMSALFKKHGALTVHEYWEADVAPGKLTSFPMAVQKRDDEDVVLSTITWPSKEVCDKAWEAMMQDPLMSPESSPMPFDGARMIFGGFETAFEA